MNRSLKLSMLLALALGSTQAAALELGQVQVKSALGQPLLAEIPVTPDSPAELTSLSARLASAEDFASAGIVGGRPPIPLQFSLAGESGHKVIRITSAVAINDPFLDLLVEVSSSSGKSVREVTILLDPPGTIAAAPARRAASKPASRPTRAPAAAPAAAPTAAPAATAARPATAGEGEYGPVERGQTLTGIAREAAPAGVDANQMLLALKQANPGAFYRDNINALKTGAVLRIPTSAEAQALSVAAAMAEVRRQNGEWRAPSAAMPTMVADLATRADTTSAPASAAGGADRLALVPAKDGGSGSATSQVGGGKAARQDLLRSQETLTTLQQQSSELKSRLKDLEDINSKNERLLSLKDNEIAELQHKLAEARKAANLPPAPVTAPAISATAAKAPATVAVATPDTTGVAASGTATGAAVAGTTAAAVPATAASTSASPAAAATVSARPKQPAVTPVPAPQETPWYMQTWVWEAAGGAAVLLLLITLLGRRRRRPVAAVSTASSLADRFGAMPAAAPSSDDPDQDELLDQLAEHPDDVGLHLELVSLYYSRRDVEHFEAAAEAMHAHIAGPHQAEWEDVVAMGEDLVPGHPLFAGAAALQPESARHGEEPAQHAGFDTGEQATATLDEFDLESYVETADADLPPAMPPLPQKKVSEYHFDFNLTPAARQGDAPPASATDETDVAPWHEAAVDAAPPEPAAESAGSWQFAAAGEDSLGAGADQFNDDPIDTKLDLARAYLDMGDADGARAMLEEVMAEGSQMQKDTAGRLLDSLH